MVIVLLLICAGLFFFLFAPNHSSELLLKLGIRAEDSGFIARAVYFYEQSLTFNPYCADSRLRLVSLFRSQHKISRSEELLREGISLQPSNTDFYTELSELLVQHGRLSEAVGSLDRAGNGVAGLRIGSLRPTVKASPEPGIYTRPIDFSITTEPGVVYYYTLDGSIPNMDSAQYTSPLPLNRSIRYRIRVIALASNAMPSRAFEFTYDLTGYRPQGISAAAYTGPQICPHCGGLISNGQ